MHVLHLKYRFHDGAYADVAVDDNDEQLSGSSLAAKRRLTVPPPFSTLHDPVLRIEYRALPRMRPFAADSTHADALLRARRSI